MQDKDAKDEIMTQKNNFLTQNLSLIKFTV